MTLITANFSMSSALLAAARFSERPNIPTSVNRLYNADLLQGLQGKLTAHFAPPIARAALASGHPSFSTEEFRSLAAPFELPPRQTITRSSAPKLIKYLLPERDHSAEQSPEYIRAARDVDILVAGATLVDGKKLLDSGVTPEDILVAAGGDAPSIRRLQAFLLRRVGLPLIDPDLSHLDTVAPVAKRSIETMLSDRFTEIARQPDSDAIHSVFPVEIEQVRRYARATTTDESFALRGMMAGFSFSMGLKQVFYLLLPYLVEAPLPFAVHSSEEITLLAPLPCHGQLFVKSWISRNVVRKSGTGFLEISRELTSGPTNEIVARAKTLLAIGVDLKSVKWASAPGDFGEPRFPSSGTIREAQIDEFAIASGDHQSPHVNTDAARELTDIDRVVVHGMMTFGRAVGLALGEIPQLRSASNFVPYKVKAEFIAPIQSGDRVEFALAPAEGGYGSVIARNQDNQLVFRATFSNPV